MTLQNILWLGGSPCSGKSSIAAMLAERHNLVTYQCDYHFGEHQERATPTEHPAYYRLKSMSWDDIWMRPVAALVADEIAIYREEFGMILDDLRVLPTNRPILAEGAALLPEFVLPVMRGPAAAIWVVPTPEFQLKQYRQRPWIQGILNECRDPDQAFQNWMDRDSAYGQVALQQAEAAGLTSLVVDGRRSIEENAALVEAHFGLAG